jgi:uncharacterized iron-regulated membrane protein
MTFDPADASRVGVRDYRGADQKAAEASQFRMATASTRLFWIKIHRWLGLTALAFLFIAGVTGSLLCFDKRIDAALNSDLFYRQATAARISPPLVANAVQADRADLVITGLPLNLRANQTLKLDVVSRQPGVDLGFNQLFVDPSDGRVIGTRQVRPGWGRRHIVEGIFQLHQNLIGGKWGRWIMGIAALGWLIGNCVGLYLTFPAKRPFWPKWKKKWLIDTGAKLRRLMLEIHNSSGLWLLIPATVLAYTSVAMNFFDEAFVPAVQAISPAKPTMFGQERQGPRSSAPTIGFARALALGAAAAKAQGLNWQPAIERFDPAHRVYGISFTDNGVENYHGLGPVTLYVDATSGRFVESDDPYHDSFGRKMVRALYPLHSGDVAGSIGIALIFLLGLSTAEMCITGFYTWWKKREAKSGGARRKSP